MKAIVLFCLLTFTLIKCNAQVNNNDTSSNDASNRSNVDEYICLVLLLALLFF